MPHCCPILVVLRGSCLFRWAASQALITGSQPPAQQLSDVCSKWAMVVFVGVACGLLVMASQSDVTMLAHQLVPLSLLKPVSSCPFSHKAACVSNKDLGQACIMLTYCMLVASGVEGM